MTGYPLGPHTNPRTRYWLSAWIRDPQLPIAPGSRAAVDEVAGALLLAKGAPRVEQARGLLAEIVHANLLASDLVARGGVRGLDLARLRQHLIDLAVRDHYSAGGVGEHVHARDHTNAV
jgi:hypothetical protein